ncbi:hypothetical protein [Hymenobacter rubidus]|uniref:hypothetical protein n=1 Tax=Hymenobacter rubidus TaxID=1441626 RepID=UPI00191FBEED|nr:hypothetical protein [Hymenobacter rubidus]
MKIPFLKQLQRLTGPAPNQIELATTGPGSAGIEQAMQHLLAELPDLLMAAVVDLSTGRPLATYTAERTLRPAAVVGFDVEAVRQVRALLLTQGTEPDDLEELLLTLPTQLQLVRLVPSRQQFVYLAVDSRDTNLGIARAVMHSSLALLGTVAEA